MSSAVVRILVASAVTATHGLRSAASQRPEPFVKDRRGKKFTIVFPRGGHDVQFGELGGKFILAQNNIFLENLRSGSEDQLWLLKVNGQEVPTASVLREVFGTQRITRQPSFGYGRMTNIALANFRVWMRDMVGYDTEKHEPVVKVQKRNGTWDLFHGAHLEVTVSTEEPKAFGERVSNYFNKDQVAEWERLGEPYDPEQQPFGSETTAAIVGGSSSSPSDVDTSAETRADSSVDNASVGASSANEAPTQFYVGQDVRVRDSETASLGRPAPWLQGKITDVDGPKVLVEGNLHAWTYRFVESIETRADGAPAVTNGVHAADRVLSPTSQLVHDFRQRDGETYEQAIARQDRMLEDISDRMSNIRPVEIPDDEIVEELPIPEDRTAVPNGRSTRASGSPAAEQGRQRRTSDLVREFRQRPGETTAQAIARQDRMLEDMSRRITNIGAHVVSSSAN